MVGGTRGIVTWPTPTDWQLMPAQATSTSLNAVPRTRSAAAADATTVPAASAATSATAATAAAAAVAAAAALFCC